MGTKNSNDAVPSPAGDVCCTSLIEPGRNCQTGYHTVFETCMVSIWSVCTQIYSASEKMRTVSQGEDINLTRRSSEVLPMPDTCVYSPVCVCVSVGRCRWVGGGGFVSL